jgi:hypothetical protein
MSVLTSVKTVAQRITTMSRAGMTNTQERKCSNGVVQNTVAPNIVLLWVDVFTLKNISGRHLFVKDAGIFGENIIKT